jgi:holliday junction DNA helicase RuvA
MIGSLRGTLLDHSDDGEVLIEVAGIGYRVVVTPTTVVELGEPGADAFVYTHHHRREDVEALYGFLSADERRCFEALIGAHGVGPTLALAILAVHDPSALRRVLADDDTAALCLVPGVGKKTAARLLIELKSRLDVVVSESASNGAAARGVGGAPANPRADVRDALANLGYGNDEITEAIRSLPDEGESGDLLKLALQQLAVS